LACARGAFPEIATPVTVAIPDDTTQIGVQTAITPDGNTLFFAGRNGVLVMPAPSPAN
jgi:hypothetical protein